MPKNIVVLSDGTSKDGGQGHDSNVYKLFKMLENRSARQVVFYDRGVGTGRRKLSGTVLGRGISQNILECYEFIFDEFESRDSIFLFGFSRGATTVRSLSGFLHLFGVLPKSRPELIPRAYKIYRKRGTAEARKRRADEFLARHRTMWANVTVLGVWDTVAALGVPIRAIDVVLEKLPWFRHRFHDLRLSKSVEHGYHALAIDDERRVFHPVLWDQEIEARQTMRQVWFPGMHSDVGGGYRETKLSDITLEWMIARATSHGLLIWPGSEVASSPDANGKMHDSRSSFIGRRYRRRIREWDTAEHGKPTLHQSVLDRRRNRRNEDHPPYSPWIREQFADGTFEIEAWDRIELPTE